MNNIQTLIVVLVAAGLVIWAILAYGNMRENQGVEQTEARIKDSLTVLTLKIRADSLEFSDYFPKDSVVMLRDALMKEKGLRGILERKLGAKTVPETVLDQKAHIFVTDRIETSSVQIVYRSKDTINAIQTVPIRYLVSASFIGDPINGFSQISFKPDPINIQRSFRMNYYEKEVPALDYGLWLMPVIANRGLGAFAGVRQIGFGWIFNYDEKPTWAIATQIRLWN